LHKPWRLRSASGQQWLLYHYPFLGNIS
jgi:hypothetical protein